MYRQFGVFVEGLPERTTVVHRETICTGAMRLSESKVYVSLPQSCESVRQRVAVASTLRYRRKEEGVVLGQEGKL